MQEPSFKDRLIDELNYQGISKKEFAERIGISSGTLGMYLYRGSIPAADIALKMALALNVSAEYLVLGMENGKMAPRVDSKSKWQKKEIMNIINSLTESQMEHFLSIAREFKAAVLN